MPLAAHSGGTPYALDFVLHHPEFLLPCPPSSGATPTSNFNRSPNSHKLVLYGEQQQQQQHEHHSNHHLTSPRRPLDPPLPHRLPAPLPRQTPAPRRGRPPDGQARRNPSTTTSAAAVGSSIGFAARLMPNRRQVGAKRPGCCGSWSRSRSRSRASSTRRKGLSKTGCSSKSGLSGLR